MAQAEEKRMRYRKRPVVIEAHRWMGGPAPAIPIIDWVLTNNGTARWDDDGGDHISIDTLEGTHRATPGDWIIRGVAGEFYPCKPAVFDATYEPVLDAS